ncbi:MAG TPA: hypothetical protein VKB18_06260 [Gemmatimonadota bacterium]|nr:hypothetical protein [Gemmatimonadota bacterium]
MDTNSRITGWERSRIGSLVVVVAACTALWTPAWAQQGNAPATRADLGAKLEQVRSQFGPAVSSRIEDLLSDARSAGVPESLVLDKALEGAAKGVPGPRVVQALETYASRLSATRKLLGRSADGSMLVAGADALQKGVPEGAVRAVGTTGGGDPMALVALGDLLDAGVPVDQAVDVVQKALKKGQRGDQLLDVPARVRSLIRQGTSPGQAAGTVGSAIGNGGPPGGAPPGQAKGAGQGKGGGPPAGAGSGKGPGSTGSGGG